MAVASLLKKSLSLDAASLKDREEHLRQLRAVYPMVELA